MYGKKIYYEKLKTLIKECDSHRRRSYAKGRGTGYMYLGTDHERKLKDNNNPRNWSIEFKCKKDGEIFSGYNIEYDDLVKEAIEKGEDVSKTWRT